MIDPSSGRNDLVAPRPGFPGAGLDRPAPVGKNDPLSVLEASYLVFLLRPHHQNFNKRVTKSPKLYFCDTGLASWLLGIRDPSQMTFHAQRGALFENLVAAELLKARLNQG